MTCLPLCRDFNISVQDLRRLNPELDCTKRLPPPPSPPPRKRPPPPALPPPPPPPRSRPPPPRASSPPPRPPPVRVVPLAPTFKPRPPPMLRRPSPPRVAPLLGVNDASNPSSPWYLDKQDALDVHNFYRSIHGVPDLVWDDRLQKAAQDWADNCWFEHSPLNFGENLGLGFLSINGTVDTWYYEVKGYNFKLNTNSQGAGHFTQVVWKSTTKLGCAIGVCPDGVSYAGGIWQGLLFVCEYWPPGNMYGAFKDNVPAPLRVPGFRRRVQENSEL
ncbi:hypothetical protein HYH03_001849 [Edaphochlamys debaryana]|uniref:SCP domain-containing protein n=1 Tax=Edaphochlamys debaryana TaxID=47281 RepID=A0A835YG24_9CHLO|nr:hypothetical protein HYH03_001849 [Edaphochlamys debaryana]|eukprot:KAG2500271.1 hypothetical protein HYH03_001849 [Edaphochlamys debaryana]